MASHCLLRCVGHAEHIGQASLGSGDSRLIEYYYMLLGEPADDSFGKALAASLVVQIPISVLDCVLYARADSHCCTGVALQTLLRLEHKIDNARAIGLTWELGAVCGMRARLELLLKVRAYPYLGRDMSLGRSTLM